MVCAEECLTGGSYAQETDTLPLAVVPDFRGGEPNKSAKRKDQYANNASQSKTNGRPQTDYARRSGTDARHRWASRWPNPRTTDRMDRIGRRSGIGQGSRGTVGRENHRGSQDDGPLHS